ncbi:MAG: DUF2339 domain-containing protein [Candidatus Limnocylindrales bacterium]
MHADGQPADPHLIDRIDGLQVRLEHLEHLVLPADEPEMAVQPTLTPKPAEVAEPPTTTVSDDMPTASLEADSLPVDAPVAAEVMAGRPSPPHPVPSPSAYRVGSLAGTSRAQGPSVDLAYIEERLAGRAMALVGGAALILGAVFFLSLAFSRGWIGPGMQVAVGSMGGAVGLAIGGFLLVRGDRVVGHVLSAVGLAVISLSVFAATTLYELIDPAVGLLATLAVAAVTTVLAVAARSQIVAGFGLVAVLAAPPVLGAPMDQLALGYMIVALSGIATVSLWQRWSWLPPLAFVISAPQVYLWTSSDPAPELAFVALLGYWSLLAISAGGEAFRRARPELSLASAPLLLAAGASVIAMAFSAFAATDQRVAFLLTLAAFHAVVAGWFMLRRGSVDPFALLSAAAGVGVASMAVPLALGASTTAVVWSAEAAVLAFVAVRRSHGPSLIGALVLVSLAGARIVSVALEIGAGRGIALQPLADPLDTLAIAWAFFLVAASVFAWVVPSLNVRLTVGAIAAFSTLAVIYHELDGVATVAASSALASICLAAPRVLGRLTEQRVEWRLGPALEWLRAEKPLFDLAPLLTRIAGAAAGIMALAATVLVHLTQEGWPPAPEVPFSNEAGISALVLAATCVAAGIIAGGEAARRRGAIGALLVIWLGAIFQLELAPLAVCWAGLAAVALGLGRLDGGGLVSFTAAGTFLVAVAGAAALVVAPPDRLVVSYPGILPHPLLVSEATIAVGAVALVLAFAAWARRGTRWADWALAASGIGFLYLLSIGIVDVFAGEAFGLSWRQQRQIDELAKEAYVALSVLWSVVGVLLTGAGLILRRAPLRVAGLSVLTLATVKVFIIDLASLDIAYRVVTLIVLGVLLIASAWAWTRLKPMPPSEDQEVDVPPHAT